MKDVRDTEIVIAPPFTALYPVAQELRDSNINLGAQNTFWEDSGAYTGEISPQILKDVGCSYVIVGHSERRQYFGESDEDIGKKVSASVRNGLFPILCIGESLEERENNLTFSIIETQLTGGLRELTPEEAKKVVIAYEPIWAIGTGKTARPSQIQEVHQFIRKGLSERFNSKLAEEIQILYGGSVKPDNIDELMAEKDIDGALVGGASLDADSFARIVKFKKWV